MFQISEALTVIRSVCVRLGRKTRTVSRQSPSALRSTPFWPAGQAKVVALPIRRGSFSAMVCAWLPPSASTDWNAGSTVRWTFGSRVKRDSPRTL